jgi:thioredoxin reductase
VRLFSPWKYLTDPVSRALLEPTGWTMPDAEALPTGGELVEGFLRPLASLPALASNIRLGHRVTAVARRGFDRMKTPGRDSTPFELVVQTADGVEVRVQARAVIDASGTWSTPNPAGANGLPVPGEAELTAKIRYGIPDVLGLERHRYAGKRVLVLGSGHSAFNALLDLSTLRYEEGAGEVIWAMRRTDVRQLFGGGPNDKLEARGELGSRLKTLIDSDEVGMLMGFRLAALTESPAGVLAIDDDGNAIGPVDEIVVTTGFRPELSLTRELRLRLDEALESPVALAPLIDPNVHSCGTVYPHGFEELSHPEKNFYTVGMKSYGRAPTFLLLTGYEQVRSVVAALMGDLESARNVELVLPETGVCSTDLSGAPCCGSATEPALAALGSIPGRAPVGGSCGIGSACSSAASLEAPAGATSCC